MTASTRVLALLACALLIVLAGAMGAAGGASATPLFLSKVDMSDPGQDGTEPEVAVGSSGATLVAWTRSDGANTRIQARYRDSSGNLGPVDTLSDPGQNASQPKLAFDNSGNAIAIWTRNDGANVRVQAAFRPAAGPWQAPVSLSAAGQDADDPQVSFDGTGKALAVWSRFDAPPGSAIVQASIRPAGGSFGAPLNLSVPGQVAYEPAVAAGPDLDNNAAVCWTRSDGAFLRAQCARRRDVGGVPRPKGATPMNVSLVNAYQPCAAPNRTHAPGLSFGSCAPPTHSSAVLTSGTPDANGPVANLTGLVKLAVLSGDVAVNVSITDVRNNPSLADYTGKVLATTSVKVTDKKAAAQENPDLGTTQAFDLGIPVQCTSTVSGTIGSTCSISTTVNSLIPGAVTDGARAIWELGQFRVKDAGPNGTGYDAGCPFTCGDGDEGTFLRQGVFIP